MATPRDRILIVENDPVISDLVGRQALQAVGYQVQVTPDANTAISRALQWSPDLIIVNLNLPGLSGKDFMVALSSQGVQIPLLVMAQRGLEADIIQAFRLGAADYLLLPAREAEVVNAVTRVLQQVQDRRAREQLSQQLQQANQQLQARVRELTTIFALGKAMTSITDPAMLLEKILDGAVRISQADVGWFLLRDDTDRPFLVAAERNLPPALGVRINQPWDDGISSLVAMSGEVLAIHGEPLRRFKISALGLSALIVPVKAQKTVVGLLVMMRKQAVPFSTSETNLLEALADYASISLVNARLFRALDERVRAHKRAAEAAQFAEKVNNDILRSVHQELASLVNPSLAAVEQVLNDPTSHYRSDQRLQLAFLQAQQQNMQRTVETINPLERASAQPERSGIALNELLLLSLRRYQPMLQSSGISLITEMPSETLRVYGDSGLLAQCMDGLFSSVAKCSLPGAQIVLRLTRTDASLAHVHVAGGEHALEWQEAQRLLQKDPKADKARKANSTAEPPSPRLSGAGIRLCLVEEIIAWHNGKFWLERKAIKGVEFHFTLPLVRT